MLAQKCVTFCSFASDHSLKVTGNMGGVKWRGHDHFQTDRLNIISHRNRCKLWCKCTSANSFVGIDLHFWLTGNQIMLQIF